MNWLTAGQWLKHSNATMLDFSDAAPLLLLANMLVLPKGTSCPADQQASRATSTLPVAPFPSPPLSLAVVTYLQALPVGEHE